MDDKVDGDAGALHEDETSEETNEGNNLQCDFQAKIR